MEPAKESISTMKMVIIVAGFLCAFVFNMIFGNINELFDKHDEREIRETERCKNDLHECQKTKTELSLRLIDRTDYNELMMKYIECKTGNTNINQECDE